MFVYNARFMFVLAYHHNRSMTNTEKTLAEITVIGKDREGVVADITNFIFKSGGNIEQIKQKVVRGLFGMHLEASFQSINPLMLDDGLKQLSRRLQMEIKVHYEEPTRVKNVAVLARYMRILSPNFVWRYPNRIINIHPSLLPAFPGAYAYVQAYERGAKIVGCTAHFVTEELDQGPIICQDSFKVFESDTLESIKKKGQSLEASTLLEAIKLYLEGRLEVYWGRVYRN